MVEDRSESSQDVERIEERYSEKNEAFLTSIKEQCLEVANEHNHTLYVKSTTAFLYLAFACQS